MKQTPKNLIIIEKYEEFVNYTYPVLQNIPRKHGVVKERILLIRKDSVVRAKRKIKRYKKQNDVTNLKLFLASWIGHLGSADSWNLVKFINQEEQLCKMKLVLSR